MSQILHAGLIARHERGRWRGVLIEGPSGAGKSDVALRALSLGFRLVADDRVVLWADAGRLFGAPAPALQGLMEVRGVGVAAVPWRNLAEIDLVVHAVLDEPERIPELQSRVLQGIACPMVSLRCLDAAAPQKLIEALSLLGGWR